MVLINITVHSDGLNIQEKIPLIRKKGLNYTGQGMLRQLSINSPVDQGLLRQWFFYRTSENEIEIRTPAYYAPFVNDGTGIYGPNKTPIYRKDIGKPFAFQAGGKMIYTRMIRGQKGQHFVEKSIKETEERINQFFIKAIREVC